MGLRVFVTGSGPVFDGEAEAIMHRFVVHITDKLGEEAVDRIKNYLPTQYMYLGHNGGNPTDNPVPPNAGMYESGIHTDRQRDDLNLVHDTPVVYGPWLEGVSDRNAIVWPHRRNPPPRRFPGYHTFRKISQQLDLEVTDITEVEIQPYIREMNS